MKKTIAELLVVLGLCVIGFGFNRGWFTLSSPTGGMDSNKVNLNLSLDGDKVKEDEEMVKGLGRKVTEEAKELGDQSKDNVKSDRTARTDVTP